MAVQVGMISLGCTKNLVDSEVMLGLLKEKGYEITPHEEQADILIVNTCAFIDAAKQESMDAILQFIFQLAPIALRQTASNDDLPAMTII